MVHIWIDTGGTFTDGIAREPTGELRRVKVLSSSCLRGRITAEGRVEAPWLTAPIFTDYRITILETGEQSRIVGLSADGLLRTEPALQSPFPATVELSSGEEAPVLAARLLTQTRLGQPFPPLEMRLGTTRGTNALLEKKGGRVALLVTKGFRDLLRIGTQQRPDLFQLAIPPAEVLYQHVLEVDERTAADGTILRALSEDEIRRLVDWVREQAADAVAVSLLNAYRNPASEQRLKDALRSAGIGPVTISSDISSAIHYVSRTQTAVVNAYLSPVLNDYLANLRRQLGGHPVRVMTSAGGLVRADLFQPKDSLLSGPAGGVVGAGKIARMLGHHVLTLDMGGTSTDVARYEGDVDYRFTTRINQFELQLPSLSIETVAAGGGSVCWFDGVRLRVGPQSAGASPGPACYGGGGALTITDVNLLLGKLSPAHFSIPFFPEKARQALRTVQNQLREQTGEIPDEQTLLRGFERIANEAMAGAIRKISVARGFDPKEYALLVFGGAGGLHGCSVADLLGIKTLILPFDAGLLSAYGIGHTPLKRMASRTILQTLSDFAESAPAVAEELIRAATAQLQDETGPQTATSVQEITLKLRLQGQESTLDVPFSERAESDFRVLYQSRYGHLPENRAVEVERMVVWVSTIGEREIPARKPPVFRLLRPPKSGTYPVYEAGSLEEGDVFDGPALLLNKTSSSFIEAGWRVTVWAWGNAVAERMQEPAADNASGAGQGAIQAELFTRRFMAIAEEMGAQLQRTAFSVNVRERLDFSCALLDADGYLVANAPHIPVHLGSLGVCTRLVLQQLTLGPGDIAITNHPRFGGSHLPDVTLIMAVFSGEGQRIGYVVNRAHHAEIGGKVPGSMPPDAVRLTEEGVVLAPQYVVRNGEFLWEGENGLAAQFVGAAYPTRALTENRADIEAAIASLKAGETVLRALAEKVGPAEVQKQMQRLRQTTAETLRNLLRRHEGKLFRAEERLDDGHRIAVQIRVEKGEITFDFSGTSAVHPHNLNANVSILYSAILYVLRLWVAEDIPLNEGLLDPVRVRLPDASLLNPVFPDNPADCPAVVGGNTEVSQRLVDTLLKALGLAACSQGTMNNFLFGNEAFGYYETIGGGAGATQSADGRSAVHQHMTNTRLTDPEELERRYPVRLREFAIRPNSGGAGERRGGDGIIRELEFLEPVQVTLLSQHRVERPYGLGEGEAGQPGRQFLSHPDGQTEELPGIFTRAVQPGQRIRIETPGGGGYSPERRSKEV
ncbi:hydantoinase B/oxoprolinase family protein [Tellurirhabdus rosea]|uniref:hydantoinase B/oxoprolinase family protein n=1 Tax=Tellurirhabdus rosea TaxID=2674997 RepID=UPI00224E7E45|nr:hydantoinase B/oxoprolinase family protein [Tellurirhabdus rosea]